MEQRTAVITGGGGDMGVACARRLAPSYRLILAELDESRLDAARARLAEEGIDALGQPLDVSDAAAVRGLAQRAAVEGGLGALVHTAGLSPTMADGARIWSVNLVGTALLMDAFRPLAREGSVAVLIASQAGHFARAAMPPALETLLDAPLDSDFLDRVLALGSGLDTPGGAYGGSKYGVIRLAIRESVAWGAVGARVVSLSPGIIDTGMGQQEYASQPFMKTMVEKTPLGRMGLADEIAKAVAFLCSDAASFVTGTDLLVDGGSTEQVRALLATAA